nr:reverse transcriptase domain-containing protein [Tanacetum cinerariifolium]
MQTRSSSRLVSNPTSNSTPSTNPNPKGRNRRRSKQRIKEFNLDELSLPIVTMADQRTMAQLLQAPTEGYEDEIVIPEITTDNFELKHDQDSLNFAAGGNFLDKMPSECLAIIESKSKVRYSRNKPIVTKVSTNTSTSGTSPDVVELMDMVKALLLDKKSQNQALAPVKAVEESCVTCGGTHSHQNCPATDGNVYRDNIQEFISQASAVNYNQGNTIYHPPMMSNQIRPPGFPPVVKNKPEATKDTVHPTNNESIEDVQPQVVQSKSPILTSEPVNSPISEPLIAPDVYVKVGTFHFPVDFVVVDFNADPRVPLILGRSFLKTERPLIDVFEGKLTLRVGIEAITFNLDQTSRYSANYNDMTAKRIDVIDMACEEYSQEVMGFSDVIVSGNLTPYYDLIVSNTSSTLTPFGNNDLLLEEVDAFLAIEDDPTSPKVYQPYLDPEGDILLLEAFLNDDPSLPPLNQGNYLLEVRKELKICEAKSDKSSIDEPLEVELKDLPTHLEYAFLEGDDKLPIIIAKDLSVEEKTALITVLKSHKRAIAWKLPDIKGTDPEFCTHKIFIEEDFEPASKSKVRYSRNKPVVAKVSMNTSTSGISPDVSELKDVVKALLLDKKIQNQAPTTVKAVEESYVTCGGAHSYRNCLATDGNVYRDNIQEFVYQALAVNYNQGNTSYRPPMMSNQIRPSGFPPVLNNQNVQLNQRNNQNLFNQNQNRGNNFNHGPAYEPLVFQPPAYQAPAYQALAPQTQGVLKEDFSAYVKVNDVVMRNMQTQGQNMQNQLTNLTDLLTNFMNSNNASTSSSGTLPYNTIANPRSDLKSITTRSGVSYDGPQIPPPPFFLHKVVKNEPEETKDMITPSNNEKKLSEMARTPLNEHCSMILLKKLLEKLGDPGKALRSFDSRPVGVAKDVYVKVGTFHFLADFVVVDFDADPRVPLILRRYFLKTRRALIDVFEGELTLRVGKEAITFNLDQTSRYSANYNDNSINRIDVIEMACEEYSQKVLRFLDVIASGNPTPYYDLIVSTTSSTLTPLRNNDFLLEEVDAFLALEDDPTSPDVDQSYLNSEGDILLLEAFLNDDPYIIQGDYPNKASVSGLVVELLRKK